MMELKKLLRPPLVVELSSLPRMMKSISFTGSPSREIYVFSGHRNDTSRSQMASRSWSSISEKKGTCIAERSKKHAGELDIKFQLEVEATANTASFCFFPSKYSKYSIRNFQKLKIMLIQLGRESITTTYTSNKVQTKMALHIPTYISRQSLQDGLLFYSSCCKPFNLNKPPDTFLKVSWELMMPHPLIHVPLPQSPLLKPFTDRLQVCLNEEE